MLEQETPREVLIIGAGLACSPIAALPALQQHGVYVQTLKKSVHPRFYTGNIRFENTVCREQLAGITD